jgi:hypothetical protein
MSIRFRWSFALLLAMGFVTAQPSFANHAFPYFREQFENLRNRFDLRLTHSLYTDTLSHRRSHTLTLNLAPGAEYMIASLCDEHCRDIDMRLYSPNGNLLQSDTALESYAYIKFEPQYRGTYRLNVKMHNCTVASCDYGVGVFSR